MSDETDEITPAEMEAAHESIQAGYDVGVSYYASNCSDEMAKAEALWLRQQAKNRADLEEARRQLAERDKEIARLTNPGRTQHCAECLEAKKEIAALRADRTKAIDELDAYLGTIPPGERYPTCAIRMKLQEIRARYQGD
jgi:hypothetical protein